MLVNVSYYFEIGFIRLSSEIKITTLEKYLKRSNKYLKNKTTRTDKIPEKQNKNKQNVNDKQTLTKTNQTCLLNQKTCPIHFSKQNGYFSPSKKTDFNNIYARQREVPDNTTHVEFRMNKRHHSFDICHHLSYTSREENSSR